VLNVKNKRDIICSIFYCFAIYLLAVRLAGGLAILAILAARLTVLAVLAVRLARGLAARLAILTITTTTRHARLRRNDGGGVRILGSGVRIDSSVIGGEHSTVRGNDGILGGIHSRIRGLVLVARNSGGSILHGILGTGKGIGNRVHFLLLNTPKILRHVHL
jgi:hypothetical protein